MIAMVNFKIYLNKQITILYKSFSHLWHSVYSIVGVFWEPWFFLKFMFAVVFNCLSFVINFFVVWYHQQSISASFCVLKTFSIFSGFFVQRFLEANSFFWSLSSWARYLVKGRNNYILMWIIISLLCRLIISHHFIVTSSSICHK